MDTDILVRWVLPTVVLGAAGIWAIASMSQPRFYTTRLHRWSAWERGGPTLALADDNPDEARQLERAAKSQSRLLSSYLLFLQRAQSPWGPVMFPLVSLILCGLGVGMSLVFLNNLVVGIGIGLILGMGPSVYLLSRKRQLKQQVEQQFPQALDMITRNLRAGQALKVGLRMVGRDLPPPMGPEFAKTVEDLDVGTGMPDALEGLSQRVDCTDLYFFVTAVKVQMETGGDLAEILENTSELIRERFKLKDEIKIKSAEARLSAWILIAIPIVLTLYISLVQRDHMRLLITHPVGQIGTAIAICLMTIGIIIIRWMTQIKA